MRDIRSGSGWSEPAVSAVCYAAFFVGVLVCQGLESFSEAVMRLIAHHDRRRAARRAADASSSSEDVSRTAGAADAAVSRGPTPEPAAHHHGHHHGLHHGGLHHVHQRDLEAAASETDASSEVDLVAVAVLPETKQRLATAVTGMPTAAIDGELLEVAERLVTDADTTAHLLRTSILTWLALSLHNLPEGGRGAGRGPVRPVRPVRPGSQRARHPPPGRLTEPAPRLPAPPAGQASRRSPPT